MRGSGKSKALILIGTIVFSSGLVGCSTLFKSWGSDKKAEQQAVDVRSEPKPPTPEEEVPRLKALVSALNARIDALEGRLQTMNDKFDQHEEKKVKAAVVIPHPSEHVGKSADDGETPDGNSKDEQEDTQADAQDESQPIAVLRESMLLFDSKKYPEAILSLTAFMERFADHALAGVAQFYIAESYFLEKEYALSKQEYQRVLMAYDRSSHVPDALRRLVDVETLLNNPKEAAKYKNDLLSFYPQSTAAAGLFVTTKGELAKDQEQYRAEEKPETAPVVSNPKGETK